MPLSKSVAWRNRLRRKLNNCRLFIAYMYGSFFSLIFTFYLSLSLSPPPLPPSLPLSLSLSLPPPPPLSLSLSLPDKNLSSGHSLLYALSSWPKMLTVISFRRRYWEFRHLSKSWISFLTVLCFYTISEAITDFLQLCKWQLNNPLHNDGCVVSEVTE